MQTFSLYALVGVANLATRAALPLAGGFEPPLPGAVETEGWRVAKLATPTGAEQRVPRTGKYNM